MELKFPLGITSFYFFFLIKEANRENLMNFGK